eukprot:871879-Pelagomonas_calceolata.AAC.1
MSTSLVHERIQKRPKASVGIYSPHQGCRLYIPLFHPLLGATLPDAVSINKCTSPVPTPGFQIRSLIISWLQPPTRLRLQIWAVLGRPLTRRINTFLAFLFLTLIVAYIPCLEPFKLFKELHNVRA